MVSDALRELSALVAEVALERANEMANAFHEQLRKEAQAQLTREQLGILLTGFAFTNWAFANGVWSHLANTRLRRDLMAASSKAVILRMARVLCGSDDPTRIAYVASNLDFDRFQPFAQAYIERAKGLRSSGVPFDANVALLFGLEWVQSHLGVGDSVMDRVIPAFLTEVGDCAKDVEEVALQVNRAEKARRGKGLWARFLEGFNSPR